MSGVKRSYRTGRGMAGVATVAGWAVALSGLAVAVLGLMELLGEEASLRAAAPLAAIAAGLAAALIGVVGVAAGHHMRAGFDTADMTRELLALTRRPAPAAVLSAGPAGVAEQPARPPLGGGSRMPLRAEPGPATAPQRPRAGGDAKVHPIFSVRPPR